MSTALRNADKCASVKVAENHSIASMSVSPYGFIKQWPACLTRSHVVAFCKSACSERRLPPTYVKYLPTPTESVGVGKMFRSVCLFVCPFVCISAFRSITQKRMIQKCPNLVQEVTLEYSRNDIVLDLWF